MEAKSSILTAANIQKLQTETDFKSKEIKKCHKRFMALDKDKKGFVSITDLASIHGIENNPLRFLIAQYISNNNENESINFETLIKFVDSFKNNKTDAKYDFMFKLFDFDKDGKISSEDMLINFKLLLGNSLNEEQIKEIVDKTISEYSSDHQFIFYDDFVNILSEV